MCFYVCTVCGYYSQRYLAERFRWCYMSVCWLPIFCCKEWKKNVRKKTPRLVEARNESAPFSQMYIENQKTHSSIYKDHIILVFKVERKNWRIAIHPTNVCAYIQCLAKHYLHNTNHIAFHTKWKSFAIIFQIQFTHQHFWFTQCNQWIQWHFGYSFVWFHFSFSVEVRNFLMEIMTHSVLFLWHDFFYFLALSPLH